MKVVIFNTLYTPNFSGGAEKSVQLLAESLAKLGLQVLVCSTSDKNMHDSLNDVKLEYIKTPNLYWGESGVEQKGYKKPLWHFIDSKNPFAASKLSQILDDFQPNIVHTNNLAGFSVEVWNAAKKHGIPIIHTLRDYYLSCPKATRFKNNKVCVNPCKLCSVYSIPKKLLSSKVDAVIGISDFILKQHITEGYFKNSRLRGVIGNSFEPLNKNTGMDESNKKVIGFIGRVEQEKGVEVLLDCFNKIDGPYSLVIAGKAEPKYLEYLKNKFNDSRVTFLGRVEASSFYQMIDVLVVPSLWNEPFGRVVLEGLAADKIVIASNKGGIPEVLKNQNSTFLFDPNNTSELLNVFEKVLPKIDFYKDAAVNREVGSFGKEQIAREYLSYYKRLIKP